MSRPAVYSMVKRYLLPAGLAFYWLCHGAFYPPFYGIEDERVYLAKAHRIAQGELAPAVSEEDLWLERHPPGYPFLLAGFLSIHDEAVYLLNPALLTLTTVLLAAILRRHAVPEYFALLLTFHPTVFVFSRTIMSDIAAAFFFLAGIWLLLYRRRALFTGGLALGCAISTRVALVPWSGLLLLYALWHRTDTRERMRLAFGFVLGVIPFLGYLLQSHGLASYVEQDVRSIVVSSVVTHAAVHLISLNLIYPLMFVVAMRARYTHDVILKTIAVLAVVVFSLRSPGGDADVVSVVLYQRLFLFVVGPILIGYAIILSRTILTSEIRFLPVMVLSWPSAA